MRQKTWIKPSEKMPEEGLLVMIDYKGTEERYAREAFWRAEPGEHLRHCGGWQSDFALLDEATVCYWRDFPELLGDTEQLEEVEGTSLLEAWIRLREAEIEVPGGPYGTGQRSILDQLRVFERAVHENNIASKRRDMINESV